MRLDRLDLSRFGAFTGRTLDFGEAPDRAADLHVVFGPNEAGKSTLFAAWLALLFGLPRESPYAFKHGRDMLEVRARVSIGGEAHELVRAGSRAGAPLLGPDGAAADETALRAAMGALEREDFATMFSLDAEGLEKGGEAILSSEGRLGELLFSGGTGLAGMGATLAAARQDAQDFFVPRGKTKELNALKDRIAALDEAMRAADLQVREHEALIEARNRARDARDAAQAAYAGAARRRAEVERLVGALEADREREEAERDLAAYGPLPEAPPEWRAHAVAMVETEARLASEADTLERRRAALAGERESLTVDPGALASVDALEALRNVPADGAAPEARMQTAGADLARREDTLRRTDTELAECLATMGMAGVPAGDVRVPVATAARLRGLVSDHAALVGSRDTALAELERSEARLLEARDALDAARATHGAAAGLDGPNPEAVAAMATALRRARARSLGVLAAEARARLGQARARARALRPDLDSDRPPPLPPAVAEASLAQWRTKREALERARTTATASLSALERERRGLEARHASQDVPDDRAAAASLAARAEAWRRHRATLAGPRDGRDRSADAFERALDEDDAVRERRLSGARALEAGRVAEARLAAIAAETDDAREALERAAEEERALAARVGRALVAMDRGPDVDHAAPLDLDMVASRVARHEEALRALASVLDGRAALDAAEEESARERDALATRLAELGGPEEEDLDALIDRAEAWLDALRRGGDALERAGADLAVAERERDRREAASEAARQALSEWAAAWTEAAADCFLARHPAVIVGDVDSRIEAVPALLDGAAEVERLLTTRRGVVQQIDGMRADMRRFLDALGSIAAALGMEPPDEASWSATLAAARARVERAQHAERAMARHAEAEAALRRDAEAHEEEARAHRDRAAAMSERLGETAPNAMVGILDRIAGRDAARRRRDDAAGRVARALGVAVEETGEALEGADTEDLLAALEAIDAELPGLAEARDMAVGDLRVAEQRLSDVGGDAAAARLASERRTLVIELRDRAHRALALEFGAEAAARALHHYRETHRSAMMERASEAFAAISCGAFAGLVTLPDLHEDRLAARRPDPDSPPVEIVGPAAGRGRRREGGLSKGTRHQLFLALRIAGYHLLAAGRTPPPFLCDDVLETFDDERAGATLRLLGEMGHKGQVIVLTHHEHVLDLAREAVPGARLHRLDGTGARAALREAAE